MTAPQLTLEAVSLRFGGVTAVDHVSLTIAAGSLHGLIGPNGAGKTTLFNLISGLARPDSGSIRLDDQRIDSLPSHARASLGLARSFQNIRLFSEMTVLENVMTGGHCRTRYSLPELFTRLGRFRSAEAKLRRDSLNLLDQIGLRNTAELRAGSLSYGDQRRLEIARALAAEPRLLLLDEPAAGMNPTETRALADLLRRINQTGVTLLLIEHDMPFVMGLCSTLSVLNFGRKIAEGSPEQLRRDPAVIEAYLGRDRAALQAS